MNATSNPKAIQPFRFLSTTAATWLLLICGCSDATKDRVMHFFFEIPEEKPVTGAEPSVGGATAEAPVVEPEAGAVKWLLHPPYQDGRCQECHAMGTGVDVVEQDRKACQTCHANFYASKKKLHMKDLIDQCRMCHHPHRSTEPFMLRKPMRELCWECHDEDEIIDEVEAHASIGEAQCTQCHEVHHSDREFMLKPQAGSAATADSAADSPTIPVESLPGHEPSDFVDLRPAYFAEAARVAGTDEAQVRAADAALSNRAFPFPPDDPAQIAAGRAIFESHCQRCHGPTLSGDGYIKYERPKKASLTRENRRVGWDTDPEGKAALCFEAVNGGQKVIGDPSMPVFAEKLSRQQMWQVIAYVRSVQIEADKQ